MWEQDDKLEMVFMDGNFGSCGTECKTMQAACQSIVGDRDTDIAEALFAARQHATLRSIWDQLGSCCGQPWVNLGSTWGQPVFNLEATRHVLHHTV
jgi:hypothetical protein